MSFTSILRVSRNFFHKKPLLANCITYGTLYVGAELSQQVVTKKFMTTPPEPLDKATIGRYAVMGTSIYSPILFTWYKWLDAKYVGTSAKLIVKKLLLDQFILTPVLLVVFYAGMSLMERRENLFEECQQKFLPTFTRSCMFWLPAQTLNFIYVPPKFRVVYVGCCAFGWVNILCWIKRQKKIAV